MIGALGYKQNQHKFVGDASRDESMSIGTAAAVSAPSGPGLLTELWLEQPGLMPGLYGNYTLVGRFTAVISRFGHH